MLLSTVPPRQRHQPNQPTETFRTLGVRGSFVERVRTTQLDDLGQPIVHFRSLQGGEPLRDLLRRALPGENIILASYELFQQVSPFREFGPVYLSATEPVPAVYHDVLSSEYFTADFALRAYDERGWIQQAEQVSRFEARLVVERWLADSRIHFIDARFLAYGCFACRFTRREDNDEHG